MSIQMNILQTSSQSWVLQVTVYPLSNVPWNFQKDGFVSDSAARSFFEQNIRIFTRRLIG